MDLQLNRRRTEAKKRKVFLSETGNGTVEVAAQNCKQQLTPALYVQEEDGAIAAFSNASTSSSRSSKWTEELVQDSPLRQDEAV